MSLRTPALPADFFYFPAWYGRVPSFVETKEASFKISCAEEWFSWRVANINALYLTRIYHADHDLARVWLEGLDDVMFCHSLKRLPLDDRPLALQRRFRLKLLLMIHLMAFHVAGAQLVDEVLLLSDWLRACCRFLLWSHCEFICEERRKAAAIDSRRLLGETSRARAGTPSAPGPAGVMKSTAAVEGTAEDVGAMEGVLGDAVAAAAAVGACTLFGDFSADLGVLSLAACGSMPSPAVLSLVAVKELLYAWETARGSVSKSWTAAISRFQRLLLFSPRGTAGSPPLCHCCIKAKAAASRLSGGTSVTSRAARGAVQALQPQNEVSSKESLTRRLRGLLMSEARPHVPATTAKASATQRGEQFIARTSQQGKKSITGTSQRGEMFIAGTSQQGEKKSTAGRPPLAVVVAAPREATAAAGVNAQAFSLARSTNRTGEEIPATDDLRIDSRSGIIENSSLSEKYQGPPGNKGSATSPQESVTECCFKETDNSIVLDSVPISVEALSFYPSSAERHDAIYPCTSMQTVPSGLYMLAAFEGLLWQQKRLLQTGQPLPRDQQEQQRQLQRQVKEAVFRGLLFPQAERTKRTTLLDWKDSYARHEWSDIIVYYPKRGEDAAAQEASVPAGAPGQKTGLAPVGAFAGVPRLRVTAQPAGRIPFSEVTVEQPASLEGIHGARRAVADELSRGIAVAIRGEVSVTDPSNTVFNKEVYRPSFAAAAAALEVNIARSCAEATADALLRSGPPSARGNAERCSHVFCVLAEIDGTLQMMQQQQVDCLRRIYARIQQVVTGFLNKLLHVASLQSFDVHSCETLYCEGDGSSCNSIVSLAQSSPTPEKNTKTAKCPPDGAALVFKDKNAVCLASDSLGRAGNAVATRANTGAAACVISHFEVLLGLHVTCEALLQKSCYEEASPVSVRGRSDLREAAAAGRAATAAGRETKAVEAADGSPAARTDGRQARSEGSAAFLRGNESWLSLSKAADSHQNCEPQRGSLLQPLTKTPFPAAAAGMRETSLDYAKGLSGGSNGKWTATPTKTQKIAVASVNHWGADTDLAAGEVATASNGACTASYRESTHRRRGSVLYGRPQATHSSDIENSGGDTAPLVPLLRRAALQRIHAVTAEILQSCGKLLQQLQYVDQAIQEALTSHTDSAYNSEERNGICMTAGDMPAQGTALAPLLGPLQLPSAAAALLAIKILQEAIQKTP